MKTPASMQPMRRLLLGLVALLAAGLAFVASAPVRAQEAPDKQIERLSAEVLARIKADPEIRSGNLERISQFVDEMVMPSVDFERMTALSVGRGWREASAEQRAELVKQFRMLLLRTYSGALSEVRDQSIRMKPLRADPADKDVIVRSEVIGQGTEPIQLDYRMRRTNENWKIYDINVLGVWLVETYRGQFGQIISQGGIQGLVDSLRQRNNRGGTEPPPSKS
ncbi:MAG: ABC transporter substrate-binding protein [Burkholderiaceae bacterium]|nr:ABC transporter substrate-binding protein [Burkholderiaceae bacterium]